MGQPLGIQLDALLDGVLEAMGEQPEVEAVNKELSDVLLQASLRSTYFNELLDASRIPPSPLRRLLLRRLEAEWTRFEPQRVRTYGGVPIGERFELVIPEDLPTWKAKQELEWFSEAVRTQIQAVEKAATVRGHPVSDFTKAYLRDGRWLFLTVTNRASVNTLAAEYHASKGDQHAEEQGIGLCDSCVRLVYDRIRDAKELLANAIQSL